MFISAPPRNGPLLLSSQRGNIRFHFAEQLLRMCERISEPSLPQFLPAASASAGVLFFYATEHHALYVVSLYERVHQDDREYGKHHTA